MSDEFTMRLRLQTVAAYRDLRRGVQRSGRENVVFAVIMFGIAYFYHSAGVPLLVIALYCLLAAGEVLVGLFKWLFPSAEGVLLDGLVLLSFAGWNLGWQGLGVAAGGRPPNVFVVLLGLYMLSGAVSRFRSYAHLRRLFAERPAPEHLAWFDELVVDILTADPHTDRLALDLPTSPHWRAKLIGGTAFFVAGSGGQVWIAGADDFSLRREKEGRGDGRRKALLRIYGEAYPEFDLDDASWANYANWMAEQTDSRP
ncbi:hypothetical protein GobsT_09050 [Gemmata obscuriglobus]|uniref:Uncharacterized protein n=1 Tax=Gemmata obscuriglobus TaxID=114 RepID=A0A2Z3HC65_9BACT|nr:hypothetical protein [Gemmata obscuriglobus]AWM40575.1 hypothetical protein C1280_28730 [Gemmata obscuriglobus]QEG26166.1 hypothetical protein GobsT_09050 [Gemmata obscuriglobus]VTS00781.1 unnamed protein product [Gemmata obscuriglobus UQM 2246]